MKGERGGGGDGGAGASNGSTGRGGRGRENGGGNEGENGVGGLARSGGAKSARVWDETAAGKLLIGYEFSVRFGGAFSSYLHREGAGGKTFQGVGGQHPSARGGWKTPASPFSARRG